MFIGLDCRKGVTYRPVVTQIGDYTRSILLGAKCMTGGAVPPHLHLAMLGTSIYNIGGGVFMRKEKGSTSF